MEKREAAKRRELEEKELKEHNALMREDFNVFISRVYFRPCEPGPIICRTEEEKREAAPAERREIRKLELNEHIALMGEDLDVFIHREYFRPCEPGPIISRAEKEREAAYAKRREIMEKELIEHIALMGKHLHFVCRWEDVRSRKPRPHLIPRPESMRPMQSDRPMGIPPPVKLPDPPSMQIVSPLKPRPNISREDFWSREPDPFFFPSSLTIPFTMGGAGSTNERAMEEKREAAPAMKREIMVSMEEHQALMRDDVWSHHLPPCSLAMSDSEEEEEEEEEEEDEEEEEFPPFLPRQCEEDVKAEEEREAAPAMDPEIMEIQTERERADSPEPSCVSLRSGRSMDYPTAFNQQDFIPKQRAGSPAPSCVSLKSDRSKGNPPLFRDEPGPPDTKQRAGSPAPSCVSMKSDRSRNSPPLFSDEPGPPDRKDPVIDAGLWTEVNSIFSLLRENIVDYVDIKLNTFRRFLTNDPEGLESQGEYEEGLNAKEKVQRRGSREGFLKITLDFLRRMNQEELADSLQDKALAADGHRKPKSKLSHVIGCMFARAMRSVPMFK